MSNGDEVGAIEPSHLPILEFFGNRCRNAPTPTRPQHGTGLSRKLPNFPYRRLTMVLPILVRRFGNVAGGTHFQATAGMLSFPRMRFNQDSIGERLWPEDLSRPEIGSRTYRALSFRNGDAMDCAAHSRFMPSGAEGST